MPTLFRAGPKYGKYVARARYYLRASMVQSMRKNSENWNRKGLRGMTRAEAADRYAEYARIIDGYPPCVEREKWEAYLRELKEKFNLG